MKRSLQVMGQPGSVPAAEPEVLRVGSTTVIVRDTGTGSEARRFAGWMIGAGAQAATPDRVDGALRVVIGADAGAARDSHQEASEATPDFVLGSARRAFAERLVQSIDQTREQ